MMNPIHRLSKGHVSVLRSFANIGPPSDAMRRGSLPPAAFGLTLPLIGRERY